MDIKIHWCTTKIILIDDSMCDICVCKKNGIQCYISSRNILYMHDVIMLYTQEVFKN